LARAVCVGAGVVALVCGAAAALVVLSALLAVTGGAGVDATGFLVLHAQVKANNTADGIIRVVNLIYFKVSPFVLTGNPVNAVPIRKS